MLLKFRRPWTSNFYNENFLIKNLKFILWKMYKCIHFDGFWWFISPIVPPTILQPLSTCSSSNFSSYSFLSLILLTHAKEQWLSPRNTLIYQWLYSYRKWGLFQKPKITNSNPDRNKTSGILPNPCWNWSCMNFLKLTVASLSSWL